VGSASGLFKPAAYPGQHRFAHRERRAGNPDGSSTRLEPADRGPLSPEESALQAEITAHELAPDDLLAAIAATRQALTPALEADWEVPAGTLDWTCRQTLDHIANTMLFYATHLATRARERRPPVRNGDPSRPPAGLLSAAEAAAAILAEVVRAAPPGTRGFHPAGLADATGFVAMGCTEIMVYSADIAAGLRIAYAPPAGLPARVLQRIFPWASREGDTWATLRWACGRAALGDQPRLAADWYWQCAPLAEWDGTVKKRQAPPAWK
jgi:hypothetical protein